MRTVPVVRQPSGAHGTSGVTGAGPLLGAAPRLPGRYGVIAMAAGIFPALIAVSAMLVAVLIGVTVPEPLLAT
jgi:hypothetical protein